MSDFSASPKFGLACQVEVPADQKSFCSSLPNVVIFATGGTIAGSSTSNTDTTKYTAGVVGIEALIQGAPKSFSRLTK